MKEYIILCQYIHILLLSNYNYVQSSAEKVFFDILIVVTEELVSHSYKVYH